MWPVFWIMVCHQFKQNFRKQYNRKMNSAQSALARRVLKFRVSRNFDKIILNFAKFEENFAKHEIKIFAKFGEITKTNILQPPYSYSYTICRLLSATHPPLPSTRRFFNVAWKCYFEMKTNKGTLSFNSVIYNYVDLS